MSKMEVDAYFTLLLLRRNLLLRHIVLLRLFQMFQSSESRDRTVLRQVQQSHHLFPCSVNWNFKARWSPDPADAGQRHVMIVRLDFLLQ